MSQNCHLFWFNEAAIRTHSRKNLLLILNFIFFTQFFYFGSKIGWARIKSRTNNEEKIVEFNLIWILFFCRIWKVRSNSLFHSNSNHVFEELRIVLTKGKQAGSINATIVKKRGWIKDGSWVCYCVYLFV